MPLDLSPFTDSLARTPSILRASVEGRPDALLDLRHAADVVSPREAVAHLLLCEAEDSWITRIRHVRELKWTSTPGRYEGVGDGELAQSRNLSDLLDEFEICRTENLRELAGLGLEAGDVELEQGDPEFGSQTVGNLLATWVAHDFYHLGQIFKSFSVGFAEGIGPYQRFLNLPHFN